jgi:hypothetical protein
MTVIQEKPVKEVLAREPQSYSPASRVTRVAESDPTRYLRIALRLVGVAFIVGIYTFINVWPSGWSWHAGQSHHLWGDVPALLVFAAVLAFLTPRGTVAAALAAGKK